jgi:hypothetical protein
MGTDKFNITIQVIGALGSLATFGAFILLFIKDRQKQDQIDRLTSIGDNIKDQNELLDASNKLLDQQVSILRESMTLSKPNDRISMRLAEIEEQKLLLSLKPRFKYEGGTFSAGGGQAKLRIRNKGQLAKIKDLLVISGGVSVATNLVDKTIEKDQTFDLSINSPSDSSREKYVLDLSYSDELENLYYLRIIGQGSRASLEEYI